MSLRAVSGSLTVSAILRRMNLAASSFASGLVAMSQKVSNMKRNPPPSFQASWKIRSRSSADTLKVSIVLSSKPMATLEFRT